MKPTIHMNGTHPQELYDAAIAAREAIGLAIAAVQALAPNGRDYYMQGNGALAIAAGEHSAMLSDLVRVDIAVFDLLLHIVNTTPKDGPLALK